MSMRGYTTRQRTLVLAFMQRHIGRSWTAAEVYHALCREQGREEAPARSTVFRLLQRLSQEGLLMQLPRLKGGARVYQMDDHAACADTLHLKCKGCGRLSHLSQHQMDRLVDTVRQQLGFELDPQQTTLYGCCEHCETAREAAHG